MLCRHPLPVLWMMSHLAVMGYMAYFNTCVEFDAYRCLVVGYSAKKENPFLKIKIFVFCYINAALFMLCKLYHKKRKCNNIVS